MSKNDKIKVVSLFSGIGGFEQGLNDANLDYEVVFASEIDAYAQKSYAANWGNEVLNGDITSVNEKDIPDHDLLLAGFPCQSFSIAGKMLGFEDTRGTLFFDVARILKEKKPKYIVLENVKNLVSHDKSKTINVILHTLNDIGYTVDFSILNSVEAGVPQNRERTYIVGIYHHASEAYDEDIRSKKINELKKKLNKENFTSFNFFSQLAFNNVPMHIKDILDKDVEEKYYFNSDKVKTFIEESNISDVEDTQEKIIKLFDIPREVHNDLERQRRVYSVNGISPTVLARSDTSKILVEKNGKQAIRKITPDESFRIQGFPESFIDNIKSIGMSATRMYKQSGNAVSPPVIAGIISLLKEKYINAFSFTFIDLFAGLGGFRIAFEAFGGKCVYSCEIDRDACHTYEENFGDNPFGDVTKIDTNEMPDFDVLCSGFPCQPFSIAGKRLGFEDTRGTLFFDVVRILKAKRPKAFFLENVKGITNHDGGNTIKVIEVALHEIGYEFKYAVLDAKNYNVPQHRERWYCIGFDKRLGISAEDIEFPEPVELINTLSTIVEKDVGHEYDATETAMKHVDKWVEEKGIEVTDTTLAYDIRPSRCHFNNGVISPCLTAKMGTGGNNIPVLVKQRRKLTEHECLRIMGYPTDYKIGSGYQKYKQLGNSVVVPLVQSIAKVVVDKLKEI